MTAIKVFDTEILNPRRSDAETSAFLRYKRQMGEGTMKKERLKFILKSLGYKETKIGNWEKDYE